MNYFLFFLGLIIVLLVVLDLTFTTLAPRGTGFITERLRSGIWKFFHWLSKGDGKSKLLNYAGMFTVSAWLIGWIVFFWVGNALMYIADVDSVMEAGTKITAVTVDKIYFVGYVISTMGLGDFRPNGEAWKIYTSIISFSGFIIITLAITYLVPVLSAEMGKRKTSIYIHSLGISPQDILLNAWNGKDFNRLTQHFTTLTSEIMTQAQNHVAYPVLHNFHSHMRREALAINLAALDEALTILMLYVPDDVMPPKQEIYPLRFAITDYLATLGSAFIAPSRNQPAPIDIKRLKEVSIPMKQQNREMEFELEKLRFRRKLLLGMLENDGWHWNSMDMEGEYGQYDIEHKREVRKEDALHSYEIPDEGYGQGRMNT